MRALLLGALLVTCQVAAGCLDDGPRPGLYVGPDAIQLLNNHGNYPPGMEPFGEATLVKDCHWIDEHPKGGVDAFVVDRWDGQSWVRHGEWPMSGWSDWLRVEDCYTFDEPGRYVVYVEGLGTRSSGLHLNLTALTIEQGCSALVIDGRTSYDCDYHRRADDGAS